MQSITFGKAMPNLTSIEAVSPCAYSPVGNKRRCTPNYIATEICDDIGLLTRDMSIFKAMSLLPEVCTPRSTEDSPTESHEKKKPNIVGSCYCQQLYCLLAGLANVLQTRVYLHV